MSPARATATHDYQEGPTGGSFIEPGRDAFRIEFANQYAIKPVCMIAATVIACHRTASIVLTSNRSGEELLDPFDASILGNIAVERLEAAT